MNNDALSNILKDQQLRKRAATLSHFLFFNFYLSDYVKYPTAQFQMKIFELTEKESIRELFIMAFRGSGKSTIISTSYPIWAILGALRKRFIVIVSQTQNQSRQILSNIRRELETNGLLKKDFGAFIDGSREWNNNSLDIPKYGARITAVSTGESIRGLRHGSYRPDLIILDDVEDGASVKTQEGRDRIHQWYAKEVLPLGDLGTKLVVVGNLLHEDSLMMKLKKYDNEVGMHSVFVQYPLINDGGLVLWPEKYTTEVIAELKRRDPRAFDLEYLLKIVPDADQVIHRDWIQYYDCLPDPELYPPRMIAIGVDPAISEKLTSDFTGVVVAYITGYGKNLRIYILPYTFSKRLSSPDTVEAIKKLHDQLYLQFKIPPTVFVEAVAYQTALAQFLKVENIIAEGVNISGLDKRTRLILASNYIQTGKILFPTYGEDNLISQIVNFGVEKHDDEVDALTLLVRKIIETDSPSSNSFSQTEPEEERFKNEPPYPLPPVPDSGGNPDPWGNIDRGEPIFSLEMKF